MHFKEYLKHRFGISLPEWIMFKEKGNKVLVYAKDIKFIKDYDTFGIVGGKLTTFGYKPSTEFLQIFGDVSIRNVVFVSKECVKKIIKGEDVELKEHLASNGYVIIMFEGKVLGCGLLNNNKLINQIPKSKRI